MSNTSCQDLPMSTSDAVRVFTLSIERFTVISQVFYKVSITKRKGNTKTSCAKGIRSRR